MCTGVKKKGWNGRQIRSLKQSFILFFLFVLFIENIMNG